MSDEGLNLTQKLAKIRDIADVVKKSKRGYKNDYADIADVLAKVRTGMQKYGVSLQPLITPETVSVEQVTSIDTKASKTGEVYNATTTETMVKANMIFRWVDDEIPDQHIDIPWFIVGSQADPSQAFGSGLTYCTRYFLMNFFQIAQDNDVDTYRSKQQEAAQQESRAIASSIVDTLDVEIRNYLSSNPEKSEEVKAMAKKYIKSGDYRKITEPTLAAKLKSEFETTYMSTTEEKK